ncbi:hypothetical protein HNR44_001155 [Geomicrobium halophilum]|uniref:Sporulation inhibitor of replication protein SirA n=1 Tax=Geomicrobium halophilum TaxID=549000 RepID=A0A841PPT9_9BACL|nr:sporulation inhibitor of replication protein SirA [Geomicrobium halophilum]MBB6449206.1 hypothetical protein [Geomicrobium halophilum]
MHRYDIYLLRPEIAHQYFQMEIKLFQLFKEYETIRSIQSILQKQVDYICRPISIQHLVEWFSSLQMYKNESDSERYFFSLQGEKGVKVTVSERRVQIFSMLGLENEWIWFDQLQMYDPYFFACDIQREKYGWLKPMKIHSQLHHS